MALRVMAQASSATTMAATDSIRHIQEVVVTDKLPLREIISPQVLSGDELRRMSSLSVADAMRYFSGIQLKDYGGVGGLKTVDIRSMGSAHLGVFYDGIELGNAQNGQIDLGQFSLDNVEQINLYNGQKSSIFQPATDFCNAGSIYIRTRRPQFKDSKGRNLRFTTKGGPGNTLRITSLWEQRLSRSVSASLSAGFLNSDGKYCFRYRRVTPSGATAYDTTATRHNGDIHAERAEVNIHGIIDRGYWDAKGYIYNSERGIPGAIVNNVWRRGERQNDLNTFLQGRFEKDMTSRFSTLLMAKYAFYRTHYINRDTTQLPVDNRYWQQELYVSLANVYEIVKDWSLSVAYDLRWNKLNADTYRFVYPTRLNNLISMATAVDTRWIKAQASVVAAFVHDNISNRSTSDNGADIRRLTPSLFIAVPLGRLTLHAFAKRSFRMPTFNDLYYTDAGNSRLRPESANQYDAGFNYGINLSKADAIAFSIGADIYYNTVHDKIIAYPKGQQFRWTMLNLGRVHIRGIDATAAASMTTSAGLSLSGRLQYTYQDARDVTDPTTPFYGDQIPYIPYNSGSATMTASWRGMSLNYSFIYSGERYNGQENIRQNHMEPWYTHDISIQYEWRNSRKTGYRLSFEINNLLNQRYDVIQNYPMPGINCAAGFSIEL